MNTYKTVKVICNNPTCLFIGNYHNTTIESVKATREIMQEKPVVDSDCQHRDCDYQVIE